MLRVQQGNKGLRHKRANPTKDVEDIRQDSQEMNKSAIWKIRPPRKWNKMLATVGEGWA
jgi:hypothetical protein